MRWRALAAVLVAVLLGGGLVLGGWYAGSGEAPPLPPKPAATGPDAPPVVPKPAATGPDAPPIVPKPAATGPLPTVSPAPSPSIEPSYTALSGRLATVVSAHPVPGARGVAVVDGAGRPVLLDRAEAAMIPASTQKLVTAAAALKALGPEFRYRTELTATAAAGADGTLTGDLVLVGSGDPALATPLFSTRVEPERPRTPLEALADQVAAAGIRHVTGRLLGDPTVLADEPTAPGWLDRYLTTLDATPVSGLTVDAGRQLYCEGVRGNPPEPCQGETLRARPAPDPAAEAAVALAVLLAERGVTVAGGPASTRTPPVASVRLASVESPPLVDLLRYTVQRSDNHMADAIFRTLGRLQGGDGGWIASVLATRRSLDSLRLNWMPVVIADGSGLSLANRLSAGFLVTLDAAMRRSTLGAVWDGLMAVAGQSGTLRHRLVGTPAEHHLHGKTGSLAGVRSLAGSVVGPDGTRLHLAVIGNDLDPTGVQATQALQDALALAVTEALYRCPPAPT